MKKLDEGGLSNKELREKRIKSKVAAYTKLFKDIADNKKKFALSMINQLAYIEVAMEDLQKETNTHGYVEDFEQGKQSFVREHPAAKSYNSFVKSYTAIIKSLIDIVPAAKQCDELQRFLDKKKKL